MKIALACPYAWDDPGGVQVHVRGLAETLLGRGHAVMVVAPVRVRAEQPWVEPVGRPIDIPYNRSNAPIDPRPWSRRRVAAALRRFGPDVVHAHEPVAPSTGLWATLASPVPVVGTFHSGADRARLYRIAAPVLRRAARRIAVRIAVSRAAAALATDRVGGPVELVPNGVDVSRFEDARPADVGPGRKLLFLGRLDERKGFPVALAAFDLLAAERDDLRMIVIGDGPERSAVDKAPASVRERVTMLGTIPNERIPAYIAACDVLLATSVGGESFGYVLVEAMAAGLPVVASDIPGYDEVITDGQEGALVPPRDPRAVAAAAARILEDGDLRASMSEAAKRRARAFSWSIVVARLEELYARALEIAPPSLR